jgi:uncharacterized membrane protein
VSGLAGGWLVWSLSTGVIMVALCFLISLITRHFLAGVTKVMVTVSLALLLILAGAAVGMARSDFGLHIVLPYALFAAAIAVAWLLIMKARPQNG